MTPNFVPTPEPSGLPSLRAALIGIVLGFIVVVAVVALTSQPPFHKKFPRQEAATVTQTPVPPFSTLSQDAPPAGLLKLPDVNIELPELFEILADYDVVHVSKLMTAMRFFGLTFMDTKTIYINSDPAADYRVETAIHEVLHIIYSRRGYDTRGPYEDLVETKAQQIYAQLYGPPAAPVPTVVAPTNTTPIEIHIN